MACLDNRESVFETFPYLESERFYFKEVNDSLKENLMEMFCDDDVMKNSGMEITNAKKQCEMYLEKVKSMYENKKAIRWSIIDKKTNDFVGEFGFYNIDLCSNNAEIGYTVLKKYWRRKVATECAKVIEKFGFNVLNLNRIIAQIDVKNTPSIKLVEKLNYHKDGVLREHYLNNIENRYVSIAIYSRLKSDI